MRKNTSIEVVSQEGPLPINVMMQEGVKALTKILSDHLQDGKSFEDDSHSMQLVFKNVNEVLNEASLSHQGTDRKILELGRESTDFNDINLTISNPKSTEDELENYITDPELHLDPNEAEIVFDYDSEIITDNPDRIGERISQMIESVLPNGFPKEGHSRLHAVVNGDELNITEEADIDINFTNDSGDTGYLDGFEYHGDGDSFEHEGCCTHHRHRKHEGSPKSQHIQNQFYPHDQQKQQLPLQQKQPQKQHQQTLKHGSSHKLRQQVNSSKYKNHNYHDYNYYYDKDNNSKDQRTPDFSVLMNNEKHMCMFCEYYMVFGEPPKNMIKWYNKNYGYNRLPQSNTD